MVDAGRYLKWLSVSSSVSELLGTRLLCCSAMPAHRGSPLHIQGFKGLMNGLGVSINVDVIAHALSPWIR